VESTAIMIYGSASGRKAERSRWLSRNRRRRSSLSVFQDVFSAACRRRFAISRRVIARGDTSA
jgi:hypothetical protein